MTSSGWAASPPFPPPCPGRCARWSDVRIMLPGYRDVVEQFTAHRDRWTMPAAGGDAGLLARAGVDQGRPAGLRPALPATLRPARQSLWRRHRAATGPTTTSASGDLPPPPPSWPQARWTRIGQRTWFTPMTGRPRWCRPTSPGSAVKIPSHPDHPQSRLSGPVPEGVAAPDRRARSLLPHRRARILRQAVVPQGRHRLRLASDHRQRDLRPGDHDAANSAAGSRACCASAPTRRN